MSYVNEEKRAFCIGAIIRHLNTLDTWDKFKVFVNGVTPAKLKAKLKKAYQDGQVEADLVITSVQEKKTNDAEMESEIDAM